ncbi:hypothetical protein BJY04DRAFT_217963 [Aspergillus karnatakaensis]|uniref:uncharacterized protein n=1 Tax=Aspergillus karnatakaensis TaxID=1810916 RepID=UPI003CCD4851
MASMNGPNIPKMNGNWILDKDRSTGLEEVLKLQGIGWLTRMTVLAATVTLKITQESEVIAPTTEPVKAITLEQVLSGGLGGRPEKRLLNWTESKHNDILFGRVVIQSHYIPGLSESGGKIQPVFVAATTALDERTESFLNEVVLVDGYSDVAEKSLKELFLHDFIRSEGAGWTAEQVWAVESVGGEILLTRRVVVAKGRDTKTARVFYTRSG